MKGTHWFAGVGLVGMALACGCATGRVDSSSGAVCQDRSRFGIPEGRPQLLMSEVENLVQLLGLTGAELIPVPDHSPDVLNRREVTEALTREYPPRLRDSGVSGTARVTILVTETGHVEHAEVSQSTGNSGLDEAALRVAEVIEFSELRTGGEPVCYLIAFPISFITR